MSTELLPSSSSCTVGCLPSCYLALGVYVSQYYPRYAMTASWIVLLSSPFITTYPNRRYTISQTHTTLSAVYISNSFVGATFTLGVRGTYTQLPRNPRLHCRVDTGRTVHPLLRYFSSVQFSFTFVGIHPILYSNTRGPLLSLSRQLSPLLLFLLLLFCSLLRLLNEAAFH
jgi:hypothetical protein